MVTRNSDITLQPRRSRKQRIPVKTGLLVITVEKVFWKHHEMNRGAQRGKRGASEKLRGRAEDSPILAPKI